jgi:hypothetical protein
MVSAPRDSLDVNCLMATIKRLIMNPLTWAPFLWFHTDFQEKPECAIHCVIPRMKEADHSGAPTFYRSLKSLSYLDVFLPMNVPSFPIMLCYTFILPLCSIVVLAAISIDPVVEYNYIVYVCVCFSCNRSHLFMSIVSSRQVLTFRCTLSKFPALSLSIVTMQAV